MTAVRDVEEYIRGHPGACIYELFDAFPDRPAGTVNSAVNRLWNDKVITSRRGDWHPCEGVTVRAYFYTHITSPGGRKSLRRGSSDPFKSFHRRSYGVSSNWGSP